MNAFWGIVVMVISANAVIIVFGLLGYNKARLARPA